MNWPTTDKEMVKILRDRYKGRPRLIRAVVRTYKSLRRAGYSISDSYTGTVESQLIALEDAYFELHDKVMKLNG